MKVDNIKKISVISLCFLLVIGVMVFAFIKYNSEEYTFTDNNENILAIYVDGVKATSIPVKGSGYIFHKAECDNGASASWDKETWELKLPLTTKTKCKLYFKEPYRILSGDIDTIGSEIKIENEEFYVIGQEDSTHVRLLSKWNLNVGTNPYNTATGKQDSEVRGIRADNGTKYGNVPYSRTNYWDSIEDYPSWVYTNEKVNDSYKASIAEYVDSYVEYLLSEGIESTGRLISYEDLESLGCSGDNYGCSSNRGGTAPEWVYQTSYWTGNAGDSGYIWYVRTNGTYDMKRFDDGSFGVRPVIIIEKA